MHSHRLTRFVGFFPFQNCKGLHLSLLSLTAKSKRFRDVGGLRGKMEASSEAAKNSIACQNNVLCFLLHLVIAACLALIALL